jgi:hypothetical protein
MFPLTFSDYSGTILRRKGEHAMNLKHDLGSQAIMEVLKTHPPIGEILARYDIGCVTCGVGICLLKDVVAIHALGAEIEKKIEEEINAYLASAEAAA